VARKMVQFRDPDLSLWQSAVDQVVSKAKAQGSALDIGGHAPASRPDQGDSMVAATADLATEVDKTKQIPDAVRVTTAAEGFVDQAKFCSTTALRLAKAKLMGNSAEAARLREELTVALGPCDPKWAAVVAIYVANKAAGHDIPYRRYKQLGDFVIDGVLKENARVALIGDWGTGDTGARLLLRQIAAKKPDAVIHLGDVYYSGTEHEFQNYFYNIWQPTLGIQKVNWGDKLKGPTTPITFTLVGNHDMYSGGQPYYTTIDMLGQPSSYFCLRNENWQFIALDTGLHDSNPVDQQATFLEDQEVTWLKDKIASAGKRKTVFLSHHQLFTAFESIGSDGNRINQKLLGQLKDILAQVDVWFWGHEHNLVIYDNYQGVLGRCIGHGAFPVDVDEGIKQDPNVPVAKVALSPAGDKALYQHGYVLMDLTPNNATVAYYQFDAESQDEEVLHTEVIGAGAAGAD
jgi:predicted phosphodiesterase